MARGVARHLLWQKSIEHTSCSILSHLQVHVNDGTKTNFLTRISLEYKRRDSSEFDSERRGDPRDCPGPLLAVSATRARRRQGGATMQQGTPVRSINFQLATRTRHSPTASRFVSRRAQADGRPPCAALWSPSSPLEWADFFSGLAGRCRQQIAKMERAVEWTRAQRPLPRCPPASPSLFYACASGRVPHDRPRACKRLSSCLRCMNTGCSQGGRCRPLTRPPSPVHRPLGGYQDNLAGEPRAPIQQTRSGPRDTDWRSVPAWSAAPLGPVTGLATGNVCVCVYGGHPVPPPAFVLCPG